MPDRLRDFLGKPTVVNGVEIFSPTIDSIAEIGEIQYNIYIAMATFNKEVILKLLYGVTEENYSLVENEDSYEIITSIPSIIEELEKALSFFVRKDVVFVNKSFYVDKINFLNRKNYKTVAEIIKRQNGIFEEQNKPLKFKNEKSRQLHEKLMKLRSKYRQADSGNSLRLKDMLSILCNAEGNGINIFNVGKMTIYQVYEHFERLNIKEQHMRLLRVWANGHLSENQSLPEWLVRSKL